MSQTVKVKVGKRWYKVTVDDLDVNQVHVTIDGSLIQVDVQTIRESLGLPDVGGQLKTSKQSGPNLDPSPYSSPKAQPDDLSPRQPPGRPEALPGTPTAIKSFRSPMPGIIKSVTVSEGDQVVTGDGVCVLEAMKMEQTLRADWTGIVKKVHVSAGQQVLDGDPIIDLE